MPVIYKSFQSVLANKEGKKLFYPRVVLTGNVDTEQVAKEIAELSSLSTGDSKNVIDNLVTVMTRHLQSSESVTLDGLGTFRLTMKSTMNGVEDPLKVSATQSTLRVRFLPTSKRNLDHTVSTRSLVTGVKCVRFDLQDTAGSGGNDGGSGGNDGVLVGEEVDHAALDVQAGNLRSTSGQSLRIYASDMVVAVVEQWIIIL